jgi:hypothetical protein
MRQPVDWRSIDIRCGKLAHISFRAVFTVAIDIL